MTTTGSVERPIPGVGVAVLEDGALLVVKRGRGANEGKWAVPGGKVDYGESLADAARREVKEETGLDVELGPIVWTGEAIGPGEPPEWHFVLVDFVAQVVGGSLNAADDATEARFVPLDEVTDLDLTDTMYELVELLRA